jgi:hypothetical protein
MRTRRNHTLPEQLLSADPLRLPEDANLFPIAIASNRSMKLRSSLLPEAFTCPFEASAGLRDSLCDFEFPRCRGCPRLRSEDACDPGDPMRSPIWHGWIAGLSIAQK